MDERGLRALALGTFHAALLTAVAALLFHAAGTLGELLRSLGTVAGLAAFALLWGLSVATTRSALARLGDDPLAKGAMSAVGVAGVWGGAAGAGFVLVGGALSILVQRAPLASLVFLAFAGPFAFLGGTLVGAAFGVVDLLLLALAGRTGPAPPVAAPPEPER